LRWQDRPVTAADRRSFGYMPEERGLYPKQPVLEQLVYLARLRGQSAADARLRARELLERFDLGDRAKDKLESLSLGNQQRVQIAAAVIAQPSLLILDEPFSGLDPAAVDSMADLLREYATLGVPVLFSSHQLDLVERLCDQLVILAAGRVVGQGSVDELRSTGSTRYRLSLGGDPGWLHTFAGVRVLQANGSSVLLELDGATTEALLGEALARGSVRELAEVRPSVSEIYREVTG
uniref:ABC transporter ATP-binding protein n=1 Tax=Nocardia lijiangensis TaxID=299618 RepID=UPI00082BC267